MRPLFTCFLLLLLMACSGSAPVSLTNSSEARDADGSVSTAPQTGFDPAKTVTASFVCRNRCWPKSLPPRPDPTSFRGLRLLFEHDHQAIGERLELMMLDVGFETAGVDP